MVDLDIIEVEAGVPAGSVADVRPGQIARLTINGLPARTFEARVVRIAPTAVEGSRTVRVYLELPNEDGLLRGGMFATGSLDTGSRSNVIALPETALRRDEAGEFVLKAVDGRLVRQAVTVDPVPPRQGFWPSPRAWRRAIRSSSRRYRRSRPTPPSKSGPDTACS